MHYGTPINLASPSLVPGGSCSGSAVSVAAQLADFALGISERLLLTSSSDYNSPLLLVNACFFFATSWSDAVFMCNIGFMFAPSISPHILSFCS